MAIIDSKVSGTKVTFTITLDASDPQNWGIYVFSSIDYGLGVGGSDPQYPYYVEKVNGIGNKTIDRTYKPGKYAAELALLGIGPVDYTLFEIAEAPPNAQIFNACWNEKGKLGTGACSIPTTLPAIKAGTTIDIKADIANSGTTGRVMAVFKIDGVSKYTDTNISLGTYPGGGLWSPVYSGFVMPTKNVSLVIEAHNWDGTKSTWVLGPTKTFTISTSTVGCTGIDLIPYSSSIKTGEKVDMTISVSPGNVPFTVTLKGRAEGGIESLLGTCKTSGLGLETGGSTCSFIWDSNASYGGKTGTFYVKAYVNSCISTESIIIVNAPILQYNFNVAVKDSVAGNVISGATILVATVGGASQSKTTDISGLASFRMDSGTISISISKNGYNTFNTAESLFSDRSITYSITPIPPTPTTGDIEFVSVPTNATILIDGKPATIIGAKTPATIMGIPAGSHNWSLKLTGYNDSNGTVIVPSGGKTSVYATLTIATPTAGSLNITSHPVMGAEIWIDGKDTKQTTSGATIITDIPPGSHTIVLTISGFKDYNGTFSIKAGETTFLDIELIPLVTIGSLEVTSEPSGARIYIDDKDTQRATPGTIVNLTEGDHRYKIILSGYKDITGTVTIIAGQIAKVHLILEKTGIPGAEILVAGAAAVAILAYATGRK